MDSLDTELQHSDVLDSNPEPYDVDVETAASLLGVGRTRLSQITSKGGLSFQRRKIGIRNRLFYRRTELMEYLERQFPNTPQFRSQQIAERWAQSPEPPHATTRDGDVESMQETIAETVQMLAQMQTLRKATPRAPLAGARKSGLQPSTSAVAARHERELRAELSNLNQKLESLAKSVSSLSAKLDGVTLTLSQLVTHARQAQRRTITPRGTQSATPTVSQAELRRAVRSATTKSTGRGHGAVRDRKPRST